MARKDKQCYKRQKSARKKLRPFRFVDLPAEVRNMIYHNLAAGETFDIFTQPPLALTNKQIGAECLPILYAESVLTMKVVLGSKDDSHRYTPIKQLARAVELSQRGNGGDLSNPLKLTKTVKVVFTFPFRNLGLSTPSIWSSVALSQSVVKVPMMVRPANTRRATILIGRMTRKS